MQLHPYIFLGIGSKLWITYAVRDGRAEISRWLGDPESIPLKGASFKVTMKFFGFMGLGDIDMSVSGGSQTWSNVRSAKSVAAELRQIADGSNSIPGNVEKDQSEIGKMPKGPKYSHSSSSKPIEFASENQLEQHRSFFARTTIGDVNVSHASKTVDPEEGEPWLVAAEWDASHKVPKRGDGQRINNPVVLGWNPRGDQLATACDAFGLTQWYVDGRRIGGGTTPNAYGQATRFFWAPDGEHVLLEASTGLNEWWSIHDRFGELQYQVVNRGASWGSDSMEIDGFHRDRCFNPWRPGTNQLLVSRFGASPQLDLLDITALPESKKASETLNEVSAALSINFSPLGAQEQNIMRYIWHPSGQYIAVTIGNSNDHNSRRIHIVHFKKGEIVASIPPTTTALGWSPGGQLLLCQHWDKPYTSNWSIETRIWDSRTWEFRPISETEKNMYWVQQLEFSGLGVQKSALSADGKRSLYRLTPHPDGRAGIAVYSGKKQVSLLPMENGVEHAAWSPNDPCCFATVGGSEAPQSLRIWRLRRD